MTVPVKEVSVNYAKVWLLSAAIGFVLWLIPLICGKYTAVSFPYIAISNIEQELVSNDEPVGERDLPRCPALSPHIHNSIRLLNNDVDSLPDNEIVEMYDVLPGGVWKPKYCHSRYHVSVVQLSYDGWLRIQYFCCDGGIGEL